MLQLLFTFTLLTTSSVAADEPDPCLITLELTSCSGEPKSDVSIAAVTQNEGHDEQASDDDVVRWKAVTDLAGKAEIAVCAEDVIEIEIYWMEDAPPVISQPEFVKPPETPGQANATVVVC